MLQCFRVLGTLIYMEVVMKRSRKFLALVFSVVLLLALSMPALAAAKNVTISGGQYVEVLGGGACRNKNVTIECQNVVVLHHNDVRMRDINGNIVWEEYGAIGYNGSRTFWCGDNVYSIEVRIGAKNIVGDYIPKRGSCTVFW